MTTTNHEALKKLTIGRTQLLLNRGQGFWGSLAMRLQLVEDASQRTLAVDGKHVFYNPDFIMGLPDNLVCSALAHEVGHCVFEHMARRGTRHPKKWNYAGDYVINNALKEADFDLGEGWLYNPAYANMSTDEVYNLIPDLPDDDDGGDGSGSGNGGPQDEVLDAPAADKESTATEWKIATIQAANASKSAGNLPAQIKRMLDEAVSNRVDWRAMLRQFVTEVSKNDYSWSRPNRRYLSAGMYLPGLHSESMGDIAIAIDTSGSIDQHTLNVFGAEIKAIAEAVKPQRMTVIYCDAEVNHVDTFTDPSEMTFEMHGGGGTDFRPPFDYIEQQGIKPACFVYLTDLYGPFPSEPTYPVIWACTNQQVAPFGATVPIDVTD